MVFLREEVWINANESFSREGLQECRWIFGWSAEKWRDHHRLTRTEAPPHTQNGIHTMQMPMGLDLDDVGGEL